MTTFRSRSPTTRHDASLRNGKMKKAKKGSVSGTLSISGPVVPS
ncbi:MAG TPA: hypothetical protein VLZ06_08810 [Solirubrobacteraceae bacterium]|nr:hypothetical protein [Solirubrobacteraceae bacterium]